VPPAGWGPRAARAPVRRRGCRAGLREGRLPRGRRLLEPGRARARGGSDARGPDPNGRRSPRPALGRMPELVRAVDDVPGEAAMTMVIANPEQQAAIEAEGRVFVSAGAGTGKTSGLVARFVRSVCGHGLDVSSVLVITYTKRAAAELRARIRAELRARGRHDLARELDGAWISTIHGFCNRVLKTYPFQAGLDPRFRELEEAHAAVLAGEAFDDALAGFCAGDNAERVQLLSTYGARGLRRMLTGIYETLRSAGRPLDLELGDRPPLGAHVEQLRDAA